MNLNKIFDTVFFYISVPKCVLCREKLDLDDKGLCKRCAEVYKEHKTRNCSRCAKVLSECSCTNYYMRTHSVKSHYKVFKYLANEPSKPGNNLIYSLKRDNRDDVVEFLSRELADVLSANLELTDKSKLLITNIPRRRAAIISFGYDHSEALARAVAKKLGIRYRSLLVSHSKKAQKDTRAENRLTNVAFDYKRKREELGDITRVIIVDDVVTTGASMASAALLIRALGAREIIAASIASSYNDEYEKRLKI